MNDKTINDKRKENLKNQKPLGDSPLRAIQGNFDELTDDERQRLRAFDEDYLLRMFIEAEAYYQACCLEQSRQMLEIYVKLYDKNEFAWNRLGTIFYENDELVKAAYYFEKAVEICPDDPSYIYNCSSTLYELGLYVQAKNVLIKFFKLRPEARVTLYYNWYVSDSPMAFIKSAWKARHQSSIKVVNDEPLVNSKPNQKGQS